MDSLKGVLLVCVTLIVVFGTFVSGCTYVVSHNNARYYDTMQQCMDRGGTFIPTKGDNSSAACIMR